MANRGKKKARTRREETREERKTVPSRELLTFSFKDFDQTQPEGKCETLEMWQEKGLLPILFRRLVELSQLTRDEACNRQQKQIKIYSSGFPEKTDFFVPKCLDNNVAWGVIQGLGGLPRVAGYMAESTFYIVFLDSLHRFSISEKKHT